MGIVLAYESALEFLRWASLDMPLHSICSEELAPCEFATEGWKTLKKSAPSAGEAKDLRACGFSYLSDPIHLLVASREQRCRAEGVVSHVCSARVPKDALVRIRRDIYAVSPGLCFAQMAGGLPIVDAVRLGCELCGTYAMPVVEGGSFARRDPLTTIADLERFCSVPGMRCGVKSAQAALRFVLAGSASPMETVVAMLLSLPRRLGGYGFEWPLLNSRVFLKGAGPGSECSLICDFYWPHAHFALEYDSNAWHTGADRIARDASRRVRLSNAGIECETLTWEQVRDERSFDEMAYLVARRLGVRMRAMTVEQSIARSELRRALLAFF